MKRILFNDKYCLTEAVLEGRKTQTRRILKPQPHYSNRGGIVWKGGAYGLDLWETMQGACANFISGIRYDKDHNIPYHVGDVVAVSQSYKNAGLDAFKQLQLDSPVAFGDTAGWKNKMFVKAKYMPHQIEIIRMELQHLQDITNEECLREGIVGIIHEIEGKPVLRGYVRDSKHNSYCYAAASPRDAYAYLIDKISGKGTWKSNPWVFKYDFRLIK